MKSVIFCHLAKVLLLGCLSYSVQNARAESTTINHLSVICQEGPGTTDALCGPLSVNLPDYRGMLMDLRDDLLDEAAQAPDNMKQSYATAAELCSSWLEALKHRDDCLGSRNQSTGPSPDMHHSKRDQLKPWEFMRLLKEMADENEHKRFDALTAQFYKDAKTKEWADQGLRLRQKLDALYRKLRVCQRQNLTPVAHAISLSSEIDKALTGVQSSIDQVLSSLDTALHDPRAEITLIRESMYDEAVQSPVASRQAYVLTGKLCDSLLLAVDERDRMYSSLGQSLPPSLLAPKGAPPQNFDNSLKKEWEQRTVLLRQNLSKIYAQAAAWRAQPAAR